jgi:salicylate hydroxylase
MKLTSIREKDNRLEITFEHGLVDQFDAVIGADGIFSSVRNYVLQDDIGEFAPSPAGWWDCRALIPYERARAVLGESYFEQDRQYGWMGDGGFIMHDILESRTLVQCVVSCVERDPPKDRKRPLTRELLTEALKSWLDGPIANGMIDVGCPVLTLHATDGVSILVN